ncbi:TPA: phosphatase PAP2 family protein [Candidatus Woesearchaeota archaeon]|nr:phosphatase PAP2 family protein [Candidatus Woesearchaeota archaeon]
MGKKQGNVPRKILLAILLGLASFFLDAAVIDAFHLFRTPVLDAVFGFFTDILVIAVAMLILPAVALLLRKDVQKAVLLCLAFLFAFLIGVSTKLAVHRLRPPLSPLDFAEPFYYSFPSLHALVAFALLPILISGFPRMRRPLIGLAFLVASTRLYFGVHYLSDVAWGAIIGYAVGWYLSHDHLTKPGAVRRFLASHRLEFRRKMAHIVFGLAIVLCIQAGVLTTIRLGILTLIGLLISLIERRSRLPLISPMLDAFERPDARRSFPGKGLLFFLLGSFLSLFLFPQDIALASILVLTFGDAVSHLFGIRFGKVAHPLTDKKFVEGAIAGFAAAFLGALLFVSAAEALVAAFAAMLVEASEVRLNVLRADDNLLIPLAAGAAILALRLSGMFL